LKPLFEGFFYERFDFKHKKHMIAKNVVMIKILLFSVLVILTVYMARQIHLGIMVAKRKRWFVGKHRRSGRMFFLLMILTFSAIEIGVRLNGGVEHVDMLFRIHVAVSTLFILSLMLLNWFFTGLNRRRMHKKIAYLSLILFLGMIGTAIPIILRL
jgi:hypothetical protein